MRGYYSVLGARMVVLTRVLAVEMSEKLKYSKVNLKPAERADQLGRLNQDKKEKIQPKSQVVQKNSTHAVKTHKVNQFESSHCHSLTKRCLITETSFITELFLPHVYPDIRLYMFSYCIHIQVCIYTYTYIIVYIQLPNGLPRWLSYKESACQWRRHRFDPWVRKIPWRRKRQHTPVFLPGKSHGQRSLVGCS